MGKKKGKIKQPKAFKVYSFDPTGTRKWCMVLDAPDNLDIYDLGDELAKLSKKFPAYNFLLTERLSVEVSEDRKKRLL